MVVTRKVSKKRVVKKRFEIEKLGAGLGDNLKVVIYGRTGTGKTTLWSTFPKPILAIVCSGIDVSGELRSINTVANRKSISQLRLTDTAVMHDVLEEIRGQYKTVVLDHATGLQDLVLKEILGLSELPVQSSWGIASHQQWGQCSLKTKEILRGILNLNCNSVIIAQEREFNTDADNDLLMPYVGAALSPSTTGWLNHSCDYICQSFIRPKTIKKKMKIGKKEIVKEVKTKGVEYCLRTAPHDVYMTRFRVPIERSKALPDVIVEPSFSKMMELISE